MDIKIKLYFVPKIQAEPAQIPLQAAFQESLPLSTLLSFIVPEHAFR